MTRGTGSVFSPTYSGAPRPWVTPWHPFRMNRLFLRKGALIFGAATR